MIDFRVIGDWPPGQVTLSWVPSTFIERPDVSQAIDEAWRRESARPDVHLFDGPMCRLESFEAGDHRLHLALSPTTYKAFLGTNMHNPLMADRYGPAALANPIGLSCALISSDDYLLMGRRNERVAYYPGRVHPFAGALEPGRDVFAEVLRELSEELSLEVDQIEFIRCLGIVEDRSLRQPEMIFLARSTCSRRQLETHVDPTEHHACVAYPVTLQGLDEALRDVDRFTPVGVAAILLCGRQMLGQSCFEKTRRRVAP